MQQIIDSSCCKLPDLLDKLFGHNEITINHRLNRITFPVFLSRVSFKYIVVKKRTVNKETAMH